MGPLSIVAADLIERMSNKDWLELCEDMKNAVILEDALSEWVGRVKAKEAPVKVIVKYDPAQPVIKTARYYDKSGRELRGLSCKRH